MQPVALKPIAAELKDVPNPPRCRLPERKDYAPREVMAYAECWQAAYDALFGRHKGFVKAVVARERAAAKAVKLAKF